MYKQCKACNQYLPLTEYYLSKGKPVARCKQCQVKYVMSNRDPEKYRQQQIRQYDLNKSQRQEYARQWRKDNKEHFRSIIEQWQQENPEKIAAYQAVSRAVKNGTLKKPSYCSYCGTFYEAKDIHGHHFDHSKPLEVVWLCYKCHREFHRLYGI